MAPRFSFLISILCVMPYSFCEAEIITIKAEGGAAILKQDMLSTESATYVIRSDFDLQGTSIRVPSGCIIEFKDGSISNGTIIGSETVLKSQKPFLGSSIIVVGCLTDKSLNIDSEIFLSVKHDQSEIQNLVNLSRLGVKTIVSQGVYQSIDSILLTNSLDIDFSGSRLISKIDRFRCSSSFFLMEPWKDTGIHSIAIRNVLLDGQLPCYDIHDNTGGAGVRRRAIQIFNVDEVVLDSVSIYNFWYGTSGSYSQDIRTRYELYEVAIMNSIKCVIRNCILSAGRGDGFKVAPRSNKENYTEFIGNHIYNFYGSAFEIIDGCCLIKDNVIEDFNGSALNAYCYDSEICNNRFLNGQRSFSIDLTEGEYYASRDVVIHDNIQQGGKDGFCQICGTGIEVSNNTYIGKGIFCRILHGYKTDFGMFKNASVSPNDVGRIIVNGNTANGINYGIETNYMNDSILVLTQLEVSRNSFTLKSSDIADNEKGNSLLLRGIKDIIIRDNDFINCLGSIMSPYSSNWITLYDCSGELVVDDNSFSHEDKIVFYPKNVSLTAGTKNMFSYVSFRGNQALSRKAKPVVRAINLKSGKAWTLPISENKGL